MPFPKVSHVQKPVVARVVAPFQATGGEPLPKLKTLLRSASPQNLANFIELMKKAPVRIGSTVRTPISPADGLAAITTGLVLRAVDKFGKVATLEQKTFLDKTLRDHLNLLSLPLSRGGHRQVGISGPEVDGLAGPTKIKGVPMQHPPVTINQSAVVLQSLQKLRENPAFATQRPKIEQLISSLMPEFKAGLAARYPANRKVSQWYYGSAARHEDQSHLKTTYEELKKLGASTSEHAQWAKNTVARIAKAWPRVTGPWEGLSNQEGSLR
jgi:hypothetical protein